MSNPREQTRSYRSLGSWKKEQPEKERKCENNIPFAGVTFFSAISVFPRRVSFSYHNTYPFGPEQVFSR
jgi:hypothetical protein